MNVARLLSVSLALSPASWNGRSRQTREMRAGWSRSKVLFELSLSF